MRDYTDAPAPQFELIPQDTIASVSIHIRAGGIGEDGLLKRSKEGDCEILDLEFTVLDGDYKGRKFWHNLLLSGTTDGQKQMADSNKGMLKAILDSALGLKPNDVSAEARARRTVSLKQFEGMPFIAKIGIQKGKPKNDGSGENWADKNVLVGVITPDKTGWKSIEQPPPFDTGGGGSGGPSSSTPSTPAAPVERPDWAR